MDKDDATGAISEKSRISLALVIAAMPALWFFATDHNVISALAHDRDELRQDVKEIKRAVEGIQLQMAASNRRGVIDPTSFTPPAPTKNGR